MGRHYRRGLIGRTVKRLFICQIVQQRFDQLRLVLHPQLCNRFRDRLARLRPGQWLKPHLAAEHLRDPALDLAH